MTAQLSLMPAPCGASDQVVTVEDIRRELPPAYHTCRVVEKPIDHACPVSAYRNWDVSVAAGKSCLVGELTSTETYLRQYTSPIREQWSKLAYLWARQNPNCHLLIDSSRQDAHGFSVGGLTWQIGARGDYVEFALPHHGSGGEKAWISRDGKTRLMVNKD